MTGESYNVQPVGKIVVRGNPILQTEKLLSESAVSGMLVAIDGSDYNAKKCTSSTRPAGWISFEHTDCKVRPSAYETPYPAGATVMVVAGGSFEIYALAAAGSDPLQIADGDYLAAGDGGMLAAYMPAASAYPPIARACESVTVPAGATARIHVLSLI